MGVKEGVKGVEAGVDFTEGKAIQGFKGAKKGGKVCVESSGRAMRGAGWKASNAFTRGNDWLVKFFDGGYVRVFAKMANIDMKGVDINSTEPDLKVVELDRHRTSVKLAPDVVTPGDDEEEFKGNLNLGVDENGNMIECSICVEDMEGKVIQTKCMHEFHIQCILKWLTFSPNCPLCRTEI